MAWNQEEQQMLRIKDRVGFALPVALLL